MNSGNVGFAAHRRFPPDKTGEFRFLKGGQNSGKPRRRLGMVMARIVLSAIGVREKQCRHGGNLHSIDGQ
jgi:hypothetical protein